ncbi:ABC polyamine/opine transporter, inner membrane subunit [Rhodobacterales bacterium HTCC2150]|nr:ABC polyamine/opine transporter, inner membrane subunit [Rhodobacterales bacterium HTCC2150] [Rhodobacteraceae bacterium HTCC2150]
MATIEQSYRYIPPRPPMWFNLAWVGGFGGLIGFLSAQGQAAKMLPYLAFGAVAFAAIAFVCVTFLKTRRFAGPFTGLVCLAFGWMTFGLSYGVMLMILGYILGRQAIWLSSGEYRLNQPPYATTGQVLWFYAFRTICGFVFLFLIAPILIVMPLSFNVEPYFSFTEGMLSFDPEAYSLRWYQDIFRNGMAAPDEPDGWWADMWNNAVWVRSVRNSFFIGICATILATGIGTLAAIGLSRAEMPYRRPIMALLISPMIVPLVIIASGMFFFFSDVGLANTYLGLIIAHAVLGTPYVIITVTATLVGFDQSLTRAAANMGASPVTAFYKIQMPLILPGMISGALFAFITSFDEVVVVLQLAKASQRTIPRQMFSGIKEQISPTILAVATILVILSIIMLTVVELLRRRSERLRGLSPG